MVRNSIQDKFNTQSSSEILSRKRLTPFFFPFFLSNFQILVTQINIELINYHIIELDEEKLGSSPCNHLLPSLPPPVFRRPMLAPLSQPTISRNDIERRTVDRWCGIVSIRSARSPPLIKERGWKSSPRIPESGKLDSGAAIMWRTKRHRMSEAIYTSSRGVGKKKGVEEKGWKRKREREREGKGRKGNVATKGITRVHSC